jgi:phosphoserine phosphatase RsbU/P
MKNDYEDIVADLKFVIDRMNFLHAISQQISEKKPLPKLLNDIMESSKLVMNAEASSLLLYDVNDKKLHFQVATGEKGRLIKKFSIDLGIGIAGWVAQHKKSVLIEDCYNDARFCSLYDKKSNFITKSMICVPLIRKNKLLGVIEVINKKDGDIFDERDLTIFETLASYCAIAIENAQLIEIQVEKEALERELETARTIQQKLLPSDLPQFNDIQVAAKLVPAKQVGGDYYNILKINENESLFLVADVAGKGIPAALIVSTICSCLQTYLKLNQQSFDLMTFVFSLNKVLIESTTHDKFVSCWFGLFNHSKGELKSINAGHNPTYIFKKGKDIPKQLETGGLFLGIFDQVYEMENIQLEPGDVVVFYTDGVTEAWNKKEQDYEERRLIDVVNKQIEKSAVEILTSIENDVKKHVGKAQQSDDFTCAVVKIL